MIPLVFCFTKGLSDINQSIDTEIALLAQCLPIEIALYTYQLVDHH